MLSHEGLGSQQKTYGIIYWRNQGWSILIFSASNHKTCFNVQVSQVDMKGSTVCKAAVLILSSIDLMIEIRSRWDKTVLEIYSFWYIKNNKTHLSLLEMLLRVSDSLWFEILN